MISPLITDVNSILNLGFAGVFLLIILMGARGWWVYGSTHEAKVKECNDEKTRADEWETKYVNMLLTDIQDRKEHDRTLQLLTQAVGAKNDG